MTQAAIVGAFGTLTLPNVAIAGADGIARPGASLAGACGTVLPGASLAGHVGTLALTSAVIAGYFGLGISTLSVFPGLPWMGTIEV